MGLALKGLKCIYSIWSFSFFKFNIILNEPSDLEVREIGEIYSHSSYWHFLIITLRRRFLSLQEVSWFGFSEFLWWIFLYKIYWLGEILVIKTRNFQKVLVLILFFSHCWVWYSVFALWLLHQQPLWHGLSTQQSCWTCRPQGSYLLYLLQACVRSCCISAYFLSFLF